MFRYRLVHARDYSTLAHGQAWSGFLSPREERILAGLGIVPRRRKWLMGRAAAKLLVGEIMADAVVPPHRISVLNEPSGAPFVLIEGKGGWEYPISLSHRSEVGMAAAPLERTAHIGADVETTEPRDPALVRQFYTDDEAKIVDAAGPEERNETVARIWSAKEAVLKLLGLGLRIDTRGVLVNLVGKPFPECPADWQPIDVKVVAELPRQSMIDSLRVMWRREAGYVLTVAVARSV